VKEMVAGRKKIKKLIKLKGKVVLKPSPQSKCWNITIENPHIGFGLKTELF
jgi:hypothetical protein